MRRVSLACALLLVVLSTSSVAAQDIPPPNASITVHLCEAVRDACGPGATPVMGQTVCFYDYYENQCGMTGETGNVTMLVRSGDVSVVMYPSVGYECVTPRGWEYCSMVVTLAQYEARLLVWGVEWGGWRVWIPRVSRDKGE